MTDSLENRIRSASHAVEPSNDFTDNLWNQIKNTPRTAPAPKVFKRWLWAPATAILVAALVLIVVTPQGVMAAIRNMLAYLPGVGFVQNSDSTLYLQEPVTAEQDGVTLTIEQVVADAEKTVVVYHIDGLPTTETGSSPCFYDGNRMLLPDGSTRLPTGGGVEGNQARVEFFPLPEGVTRATLLASIDFPDPACTAPQEWKVEFSLGTTPPESEMMPVYFEPTAIAMPESPTVPDSSMGTAESASEADVRLVIDQVAVLDDGYLLAGHIEWTEESWRVVNIMSDSTYATDAAGKRVPLEPSDEGNVDNAFAFKVCSKDFIAPLTLHVDELWVFVDMENAPTFTFDAGSDPQVGQNWDLNEDVEITGQRITVHRVSVIEGNGSGAENGEIVKGYAVEISSDTSDYLNGIVWCGDTGVWGEAGMATDTDRLVIKTYYPDTLPTGEVTCRFDIQFDLEGDWQVEWQPSPDMQ